MFATLRRVLVRRSGWPTRVIIRTTATATETSTTHSWHHAPKQSEEPSPSTETQTQSDVKAPAPPQNYIEEDDDEEDESESEANVKKKKKKKRTKWVAKLLHQSTAPKDRVHRKKRHVEQINSPACHELLHVATDTNMMLLCKIFTYVPPLEPAQRAITVNKMWAKSVDLYYRRYYPGSRPRAYLAPLIFRQGKILNHIMGMLSAKERIRVIAVSRTFCALVDSFPLYFHGFNRVNRFMQSFPICRLERRFQKVPSLHFDAVEASEVVHMVELISQDEGDELFISLHELSMRRLPPFESDQQFIQLVQALFSDRFARSLTSLIISELELTDDNYKQLARLFYDGRFPHLQVIDLSFNLFTSRFMRKWAKSFHEGRFPHLQSLNIANVHMTPEDMERFFNCIGYLPQLQELNISYNYCNVEGIVALMHHFETGGLRKLTHFNCSAIAAHPTTLARLLSSMGKEGVSPQLEVLNLSGNVLTGDRLAIKALSHALKIQCWPLLTVLDLSFTIPDKESIQELASGFAHRTTLRHLNLAGNAMQGLGFEMLMHAMEQGVFSYLHSLNLSSNAMGVLEFEMLYHALNVNGCPVLQTLDLSGNRAGATGIARFGPFFHSQLAQTLYVLDLSDNDIPSRSLVSIADLLMTSSCTQLCSLNLSRNQVITSLVPFQQLIRSNKCPSLVSIQVGYIQSYEEGRTFVKRVQSNMSVDELRRLKQLKFESQMKSLQQAHQAQAHRTRQRCLQQSRHLRDKYDHLENEAERALRRRKQIRTSSDLYIHEEIQQRKQEYRRIS